jgi:fibronectin type 3 domain-containing protein
MCNVPRSRARARLTALRFALAYLLCLTWLGYGPDAHAQSSTPTGLTATNEGGSILLTWNAVTSVQQYNIYRATTSGGPYTKISTYYGPAAVDSNVTLGVRYYYTVTALISGGESGFSNQASVLYTGPVLATAAAANPSPVTGTTAALSVLGADFNGENTLTYTWQQTQLNAPAQVTFGINGTNAAKNTTVKFTKAGIYYLSVSFYDPNGAGNSSAVQVTVQQTPTALTVTPASGTVQVGGTQQFAASVTDQFSAAIASPVVTWSVPAAAGTLSTGGLFTAGTTPGTYTVTATDGSATKTASVIVLPAVSGLSLSPASVAGGTSSTGTVTLSGPAPTGGFAVTLTSNNAVAPVPTSVTVPAGSTLATFPVTTTSVSTATIATISAAADGATKTATLTVNISAFKITGINNGDTLSGDIAIPVSVTEDAGLLTLAVDGVDADSSNITFETGQAGAGFSVHTNRYANGPHTLTVTDPEGRNDVRTVMFSNTISSLSYDSMFDPTPGTTDLSTACNITASLASAQPWQVAITDDSNNPIRTYTGNGTNVSISWNGTNAQGQSVPADDYLATITSGVASASSAGASVQPYATSSSLITVLINRDNYADSIITPIQ